jgi:uncharacterized protein YjbI with pentapeptide repeats
MVLSNCSFKNIDLTGVDLSGSDLNGADLTGTDLTAATLTDVTSGGIIGVPSHLPAGWQVLFGYLVGPGANLTGANFWNKNLTNANLVDANLTDAYLDGTILTNADFSGATLTNVAGRAIVGRPVNLPSPWRLSSGFLIGPTANLGSVDLGALNLSGFDITGANFSGSVFNGADLTDVDLSSTFVINIAFYNCNLTRTDFTGLDVEGIRTQGISGTPIGLPSNFKIISGVAIGPYANLSSLNLMNINFSGTNLHHASLGAANLTGASLANVDLTLTQFTNVNLTNANITNTNLTGVDLSGVISSGLIGTPIGLDSQWQLYQGYLIGPKANLSSVDFSNKDLRDAHLKGVFLIGANLSGANLTGVDLSDTNLTGVLLISSNLSGTNLTNANLTNIYANGIQGTPTGLASSWRLLNGYLIGPQANLNNADLAGLDLSGMDLTGASLRIADLTGANLSGANLTDTVVTDANFTDANLTNVISSGLTGTPFGMPRDVQLVGGKMLGIFFKTPVPTISGKFAVGQRLTAVQGTWDAGVTLSYQWTNNGAPIADATSAQYILQPNDVHQSIALVVTGTATGGVTRFRTSKATAVAVGVMKTAVVAIVGKLNVGKTVTARSNVWVANAKVAYSWLLDGKVIKGQAKSKLKIIAKYKGHKISVAVTQAALGYKEAKASSKLVAIR